MGSMAVFTMTVAAPPPPARWRSREGMSVEGFRPPRWAKPAPLGAGQAADAAHFVAAPLLAASCVAMIGVVGADGDEFRWPGQALLALALATMALVACIQYGFHARALLYSVGDLEAWWGRHDLAEREESLRRRQQEHFDRWKSKINRAVAAYNIGVTLLALGVALCLAPPEPADTTQTVFRWLACAAVSAGALGEFLWTVLAPRPPIVLPAFKRRRGD